MKTHCVHGHEFTAETTRIRVMNGAPVRICRLCDRERGRRPEVVARHVRANRLRREVERARNATPPRRRAAPRVPATPTPDDLAQLIKRRVDTTSGCWRWLGAVTAKGYAMMGVGGGGRPRRAHRVSYEVFVGAIPPGLTVDHLCHNADRACPRGAACQHRRCVNPAHLEVVTPQENSRRARGFARHPKAAIPSLATHCVNGHSRDEYLHVQPSGRVSCRACNNDNSRRYRGRVKTAAARGSYPAEAATPAARRELLAATAGG